PAMLVDQTMRAAIRIAAGEAIRAGAVSARVASLMERTGRRMFIDRIKIGAVSLMALGFVAAGAIALAAIQPPRDDPKPVAKAPAPLPTRGEVRTALQDW